MVAHSLSDVVSWVASCLGVTWPWLLLALAMVNLARSVLIIGSLVGPGLLAATALAGLLAWGGTGSSTLVIVIISGLSFLAGMPLIRWAIKPREEFEADWAGVMITSRPKVPEALGQHTPYPRLTLRAVVGELRVDFAGSTLDGDLVVQVTAIAGHIHLTVPHTWPIVVCTSGTALTRIIDTGDRDNIDAHGSPIVALHLLGLCGAVSLVRS